MSTHYIEEAERLADTVTIMSHGKAVATGPPRELIAEHAGRRGGRGLRAAGASCARSSATPRPRASAPAAPAPSICVLRRQRRQPRRRAPPDEPRGRLRAAHRGGDRVSAAKRLGRLERPALLGVLVREIINFARFWRSSTFSATVEPTVYLLAFGFGFGSLVVHGRRLRLRRVRRHRHGRHRGAVLQRLPGHVRDVRQVQVPAHLRRDPRRARGHRGARHGRGAVDRACARAPTAARRCSWRCSSGWTRAGGCCSSRSSAMIAGFGWANFGIGVAARDELDRQLQLHDQRRAHAAVPGRGHVLPDRRPARSGRRCSRSSTRSTTSSSSSATPCSAWKAGSDLGHLAFLIGFGAADLAARRRAGWSAAAHL